MSLDEHLILFFVNDVYNVPKSGVPHMEGTRAEIERYLMQFLYSLKYYSTRWRRARLYAEMAGFLHV